jgi:perosamine synthetase
MIPLTVPSLTKEEANAAYNTVLSGWVTQGPKVAEFERIFSEVVNAKFAIAVSNCTTALQLGLIAVGVRPGDLVITVSHSFIATANSVRSCGAEPLFIDIDPSTFNIDPDLLEDFLVSKCFIEKGKVFFKNVQQLAVGESPLVNIQSEKIGRIAAIVPVHQLGMPANIERIVEIADKFNLPVVEDAACAIGSEFVKSGLQEKIGKPHGSVACFSFHPRKVITTGDGGMLTTNSREIFEKCKLLRHHGMSISDVDRHKGDKVIIEEYVTTGYNYRLTDIQASIGIEQLLRLDKIVQKRRSIADYYMKVLSDIKWLNMPNEPEYAISNWQSFAIGLTDDAPIGRDSLMQVLFDNGIQSKPGVMNAHSERPYRDQMWNLPNSESVRNSRILIPLYDSIERAQMDHIVNTIKSAGRL